MPETVHAPPERAPAAQAAMRVAQAIDHIERAAVCLASALDHVPNASIPTEGTRLILEGARDDMRRHREALLIEHDVLAGAAASRRAEGRS
jgi:hypothetical protein